MKAWTLRGTLHLHPADELGLWLAARRAAAGTSPDDPPDLAEWRDPAGVVHPPLAAADVKEVRTAVWEALDGRCLLREEIAEEVVRRVDPAPRERLRSGFAFFLDGLCQGPPQGANVTFARPDQWIDGWRGVDERRALLVSPARPLTKAQRAELDAETERIGEFLGLDPVVTVA